jgi:hypothetical protein
MMERASLLDGTVEIISRSGAGTTIDMTIPLVCDTRADMRATTRQAAILPSEKLGV